MSALRSPRREQQLHHDQSVVTQAPPITGIGASARHVCFLTITGRLKELIIRGGQNIAPAEIEEVACLFEGGLDCAVLGAPHEHLGEVPVIFVVTRGGHDVATTELLSHCRERLSAYKIPQEVYVVDEIPRTGSGKIMRYKLRAQLSSLADAAQASAAQ